MSASEGQEAFDLFERNLSGLNSPPIPSQSSLWRGWLESGEGAEQVAVTGDAAVVLRRAAELAIGANGLGCKVSLSKRPAERLPW